MRRLVLASILLAMLAGCGGPSAADVQATVGAAVQGTATAEQVARSVAATQTATEVCGEAALNTYADAVEEEIKTFEMQAGLASSTPRASLGTPLQELLNIQTETRRMKAPECLKEYHERVVSMMGLYRIAYETFAAQGDESLIEASLILGGETLAGVKKDLATIRQGQVPPTPTPGRASAPTAAPATTGKGASSATAVSTSGERIVLYEITGSADQAFVTYTNARGGIEQRDVSLPWSESFPGRRNQFLSLSVQNRSGSGTVSCRITVNKSEIQKATSDAAYGIASCSGAIP